MSIAGLNMDILGSHPPIIMFMFIIDILGSKTGGIIIMLGDIPPEVLPDGPDDILGSNAGGIICMFIILGETAPLAFPGGLGALPVSLPTCDPAWEKFIMACWYACAACCAAYICWGLANMGGNP